MSTLRQKIFYFMRFSRISRKWNQRGRIDFWKFLHGWGWDSGSYYVITLISLHLLIEKLRLLIWWILLSRVYWFLLFVCDSGRIPLFLIYSSGISHPLYFLVWLIFLNWFFSFSSFCWAGLVDSHCIYWDNIHCNENTLQILILYLFCTFSVI